MKILQSGHAGSKGSSNPDFEERVANADRLKPVAAELNCQHVIAWCLSNDKMSTVMIGTSSSSQLEQNHKALKVVDKLTPEVKAKIEVLVSLQTKAPTLDVLSGIHGLRLYGSTHHAKEIISGTLIC